jgi:hypothetical protein
MANELPGFIISNTSPDGLCQPFAAEKCESRAK